MQLLAVGREETYSFISINTVVAIIVEAAAEEVVGVRVVVPIAIVTAVIVIVAVLVPTVLVVEGAAEVVVV